MKGFDVYGTARYIFISMKHCIDDVSHVETFDVNESFFTKPSHHQIPNDTSI